MEGVLPPATLSFLREHGVPEVIEFRGIDRVFALDLELLLSGSAFRVGGVDRGWYSMAIQRSTGHFGYVFAESELPLWCFCNSSLECFLACFAASERLGVLEAAKQVVREARGDFLEREIRQIDPAVLAHENNIWSFLVEELRAGVV
jgi:hypothetical protein